MLSSYDLVSKAIPGIVATSVAVSLLPRSGTLPSVTIGENLADYALVLLVSLLLTLFVGEGIHIAGVFVEKTLLFVGRAVQKALFVLYFRYQQAGKILRDISFTPRAVVAALFINGLSSLKDLIEAPAFPDPVERGAKRLGRETERLAAWIRRRTREILQTTVAWVRRRYWGLHDTFKGHRLLFADSLMWNFARSENLRNSIGNRWDERAKGLPYSRFEEILRSRYDKEIEKVSAKNLNFQTELGNLYTLVRAQIGAANTTQSARYQAVYGFCRSMYLVCLLTAAAYAVVVRVQPTGAPPFVTMTGVAYETQLLWALPEPVYPFVPVVSAGLAVVFMIGTGKYKRHFVDYSIAEFTTALGTREAATGTTGGD